MILVISSIKGFINSAFCRKSIFLFILKMYLLKGGISSTTSEKMVFAVKRTEHGRVHFSKKWHNNLRCKMNFNIILIIELELLEFAFHFYEVHYITSQCSIRSEYSLVNIVITLK